MAVLVLDKRKTPLMPCTEKRARLLLDRGRAVVVKLYPLTIRLRDRVGGETQPVRIKLDPGSKTTGIAVTREEDGNKGTAVLFLAELTHRGRQISEGLTSRRACRRRRRGNLRYRAPRFDNRRRPQGWLPPSLKHRVDTTTSLVERLRKLCPVTGIAVERVRFDMQLLENPEISGVGYQQGTLAGYEVREYILERDGRCCAYCGVTDVPLNLDHVIPRSRGGSNRVSNLVCACVPCNEEKGPQPVEVFLKADPRRLAAVKARLKAPLKDAAAVNATVGRFGKPSTPRTFRSRLRPAAAPGSIGTTLASRRRTPSMLPASASSRRCRTGRYRRLGSRRPDAARTAGRNGQSTVFLVATACGPSPCVDSGPATSFGLRCPTASEPGFTSVALRCVRVVRSTSGRFRASTGSAAASSTAPTDTATATPAPPVGGPLSLPTACMGVSRGGSDDELGAGTPSRRGDKRA